MLSSEKNNNLHILQNSYTNTFTPEDIDLSTVIVRIASLLLYVQSEVLTIQNLFTYIIWTHRN